MLTFCLLKTIICQPKGLQIRLKVFKVSNHVETFEEADHPAATLLSHGLFLPQPTPASVKDPVLLGVLNQKELRDEDPEGEFGVFWSAREYPLTLDETQATYCNPLDPWLTFQKRCDQPESPEELSLWSHHIALTKHGIIKNLPRSLTFDVIMGIHFKSIPNLHLKEFCTQTMSSLCTFPIDYDIPPLDKSSRLSYMASEPYPYPPSQIFIALMRFLLNSHKAANTLGDAEITLSSADKRERSNMNWYRPMGAIGKMISSLHSTLVHLKRFLPPRNQADLESYNSAVNNTQKELHDLAEAVLILLLQPFCDNLEKVSIGGRLSPPNSKQINCESIATSRVFMHSLMRIGSTEFSALQLSELEEIATHGSPLSYAVLSTISECLDQPHFKNTFCFQLEANLQKFHLESDGDLGILQKIIRSLTAPYTYIKSPLHWLMSDYVTEEYTRLGDTFFSLTGADKIFSIGSAKSKIFLKFGPELNQVEDSRVAAVVTFGETSICILYQHEIAPDPSKPTKEDDWDEPADPVLHVQVFRDGEQTAAFPIGPSLGRGSGCYSLTYFTGRYFGIFTVCTGNNAKIFQILDLKPCLQNPPQPPVSCVKQLPKLSEEDTHICFSYTFSDGFLSWVAANPKNLGGPKGRTLQPFQIEMIKFAGDNESQDFQTIPCGPLFLQLAEKFGAQQVYSNWDSFTKLVWSRDYRKLYYTHWRYHDKNVAERSLMVACFRVEAALDSMSEISSSCFNLNHIMKLEVAWRTDLEFNLLNIRGREYLVLDIMKKLTGEECSSPPTILARCLFTVRSKQVHWVPVNGQLFHAFPPHIGTQIKHPGYESSWMSLFHHRRVFSADKIVSAVCRLHYKLL